MAKPANPDFEGMGIDDLKALIQDANRVLDNKIEARRTEILTELQTLGGLPDGITLPKPNGAKKPTIKYRNIETGETWSGRGQMANWLKAKIDAGEKKEDYLLF